MISSSHVCFMSSIIACSVALGFTPSPSSTVAGTCVSALPRALSPSELARRLAGSMVHTRLERPSTAARSASVAATVVLPTPPEPTQTRTRLFASAWLREVVLMWLPSPGDSRWPITCSIAARPKVGVKSRGTGYTGACRLRSSFVARQHRQRRPVMVGLGHLVQLRVARQGLQVSPR